MHYKNGREAKIGDLIVAPNYTGPIIGTLIRAQKGSSSCNGTIAVNPVLTGQTPTVTVTIGECLHYRNVFAVCPSCLGSDVQGKIYGEICRDGWHTASHGPRPEELNQLHWDTPTKPPGPANPPRPPTPREVG